MPWLPPFDGLIYLKGSPKLIVSQGTYCWWGAFLSNAGRIYFPLTESSIWSPRSHVDLRVDEERYVYVNAKPWVGAGGDAGHVRF